MKEDVLKKKLFDEIRKLGEFRVQGVVEPLATLTDDELNSQVFKHNDSLRLTLFGFLAIKKIFTAYSFSIDKPLKTRHQMALNVLTYPYYITTKSLILFAESDVMIIKLHGSVESFLENCYQIDS